VDSAGADADFGAEAVTVAVGEAGGAVPEDIGGIDEAEEAFGLVAVGGCNDSV
jgi:hypothetical protein